MEYNYLIEFIPPPDDHPYCAKGTYYEFEEEVGILIIHRLGENSGASREEAMAGIRKKARMVEKNLVFLRNLQEQEDTG